MLLRSGTGQPLTGANIHVVVSPRPLPGASGLTNHNAGAVCRLKLRVEFKLSSERGALPLKTAVLAFLTSQMTTSELMTRFLTIEVHRSKRA